MWIILGPSFCLAKTYKRHLVAGRRASAGTVYFKGMPFLALSSKARRPEGSKLGCSLGGASGSSLPLPLPLSLPRAQGFQRKKGGNWQEKHMANLKWKLSCNFDLELDHIWSYICYFLQHAKHCWKLHPVALAKGITLATKAIALALPALEGCIAASGGFHPVEIAGSCPIPPHRDVTVLARPLVRVIVLTPLKETRTLTQPRSSQIKIKLLKVESIRWDPILLRKVTIHKSLKSK